MGSGKGTESGNSRLLFPDISSARKEWKVTPSNRSFFTKSIYKQTAFQDGDSQASKTINNDWAVSIDLTDAYLHILLPIKFPLNPTYSLGGDVIWRIPIWLPWWPSWISERNNFSHSESLCLPSSFGSIRPTVWDKMSFEEFQDGRHGHLRYRNGTILAILNLYNTPMPPIKFWLNLTHGLGGGCCLKNFKMASWRLSWPSERNDVSNSESLFHCNASHQVLAQSNLRFGRRCCLKNSKMATMAVILDIGTQLF